jgi:hypothetical protein
MSANNSLDGTKRLMGALGRMPPKPHSEMKIGKSKAKQVKRRNQKTVSTKRAKE